MFTHSPPFWYRPAAAPPPPSTTVKFMGFDDVFSTPGQVLDSEYTASRATTFGSGWVLDDANNQMSSDIVTADSGLSGPVCAFNLASTGTPLTVTHGSRIVALTASIASDSTIVLEFLNASNVVRGSVTYTPVSGSTVYPYRTQTHDLSAYADVTVIRFSHLATPYLPYALDNFSITS
jgi:hypothetical protein